LGHTGTILLSVLPCDTQRDEKLQPVLLLHGKEIALPNSDVLKAKLPKEKGNFDQD